jgi:hypothetical protein
VLPYTFISDTWGRGGQWEKEQVVPVMDRAILCHCLSVWMTPISQVITLSPTRFSRPPLDCQPTVSVPHSSALHKVHLAPCHLLGRAYQTCLLYLTLVVTPCLLGPLLPPLLGCLLQREVPWCCKCPARFLLRALLGTGGLLSKASPTAHGSPSDTYLYECLSSIPPPIPFSLNPSAMSSGPPPPSGSPLINPVAQRGPGRGKWRIPTHTRLVML